jgi:hypothetical protein
MQTQLRNFTLHCVSKPNWQTLWLRLQA